MTSIYESIKGNSIYDSITTSPRPDVFSDIIDPNKAEELSSEVLGLARKYEVPTNAVEENYGEFQKSENKVAKYEHYAGLFGGAYAVPTDSPTINPLTVLRESAKGIVRWLEGGFSARVGGTFYEWIGDFMQFSGEAVKTGRGPMASMGVPKEKDRLRNILSQALIVSGKKVETTGINAREWWVYHANTGWEALDPELKKLDPVAYHSGKVSEGIGSSALAVLAVYLSGGAAAPVLLSEGVQVNTGLVALSTLSAAGSYQHAKEQKENFLWSTLHGFADGTIEYAMESYFLDGIKETGRIVAGLKEGTEEFFTGMLQNTRAFYLENTKKGMSAYEAAKDAIWKSLKQSPHEVAAGFIGGYGVRGGADLQQLYKRSQAIKQAEAAKGKATPEQLEIMQRRAQKIEDIIKEGGTGALAKLKAEIEVGREELKQAEIKDTIAEFEKEIGEPPAAAKEGEVVKKPKKVKLEDQQMLWSEMPKTGTEETQKIAQAVENVYNASDIELQRVKEAQKGIGKLWRKVKRAVVDTSANIKKGLLKEGGKYGKEAIVRHDLIKGSSSKATKIINDATKKIYKDLNKDDSKLLDRIIQSRRIIAIDAYKPAKPGDKALFASIKHPGGLTATEHQEFIDSIPEAKRKQLNEKADVFFKEMKNQLDALHDAGLLTDHLHDVLTKAGDYEPRRFIQYIDPESTYTFGGKTISVPNSGLKKLDTGSYEALENDSQLLLAETVRRTQARVFRNNANQSLWQMIQDVPDNAIVREAEIENISDLTSGAKYTYKKAPGGYQKISVVVKGIHREMLMPTELAKEWVISDPAINANVANLVGWMSGSKILKPMATGLNPEFAVANLPRDIAHILLTTEEYSPILPVALGQMAKDLNAVKKDAFTRSGRWLDYIDEGGGMEFLTHQGSITSKTQGVLNDVQTALGYLGETSEIWTRLALRERALRNGKTNIEATWIARNYLDFGQGGQLAKAVDTAVPYLNASIQGTRGIFRAAARDPATFSWKVSQLGMFAIGLALANRYGNKEAWDNVSSHEKANNFIITTPLSYKDKNGQKRYLYFRIPKDQGQKLICSVYENLMAKFLGDEIDVDQVTDAARGLVVMTPSELLPPTMDAMLGYASNKDFWRNQDVWKGAEVVPKEEYTKYTHPAYVKIGEVTGLSPERTRYALQQYFTYGNIYSSMVGAGLRQIMETGTEAQQEKIAEDILRQAPFVRRIMRATDPFTEHERVVERIKLEEQTRIYKQTREFDGLLDKLYSGQIDADIIDNFINKQPVTDTERLMEREIRYSDFHKIPDRRWWLEVSYMAPEAAATAYWARYKAANDKEKKRLSGYLEILPGIASERFVNKLALLMEKK